MNNLESAPQDTTNAIEPKFSENECCGIYGLKNKINGKWYVGQSINIARRFKEYKMLKCRRQHKIYAALKKYGFDGFDAVVLEKCHREKLNEQESYWIDYYNAIDMGYNILSNKILNASSTAIKQRRKNGLCGKKLSMEHKRKIGDALRGKPKSEQFHQNLKQKTKEYNYLKDHPELWTDEFRVRYIAARRKKLKLVNPAQQ